MQLRGIVLFAATIRLLFVGATAEAAPAPTAEPAALSVQWAAAWSAKDLDGLMALYAPEPAFLTTSGERWKGTATIRAHFAEGLAEYNPQLTVTSLESEASGDLAYDSGSYEETTTAVKGGGAIRAKGNYLFIFQRQTDGRWKILEQAWTQAGVARM
jgi:uncharacterized protein (TIGR02246 family)